jgi:hypothetical protein
VLRVAVYVAWELAVSQARAEPLPLRITYEAAPACPGAEVFLDEIHRRTSLARAAAPTDEALEVVVRIVRRGTLSSGHLLVGQGRDGVVRDIDGESCDEVVSALALVTALAIDPNASMAPKPPPAPLPAPPPTPTVDPPEQAHRLPPDLLADPLPVLVDVAPPPEPPASRWLVGARALADVAVAPRALLGGGLFAHRLLDARFAPSVRLALDVAGTGGFDAGPGGVWFLRVLGRVQGCVFSLRPVSWLSVDPCLELQGGALHAEGVLQGAVHFVRQTTIAWAGAGLLPRVGVELGSATLDLQGGPVFPAVRHAFVFVDPAYTISTVPPVTVTMALGLGGRFP